MARISTKHRKAIEAYSELLLEKMNLQNWRVGILDEPPQLDEGEDPSDGPTAQLASRSTNRYAALRFSDRFFDDNDVPDDIRTLTLVHEHCHLYFEDIWHFFYDTTAAEMNGPNKTQAERTFRTTMELGLDQLTVAMAKFMPPFKLPR